MSITLTFSYSHLFEEDRPNEPVKLLSGLPSKYVIGMIAAWNDTLSINGAGKQTQLFLLRAALRNFTPELNQSIVSKAVPRIASGYELFAAPFIVEFINQELIDFRDDDGSYAGDYAQDEMNVFRVYVAIMDKMVDEQTRANKKLVEGAKEGGPNIRKLLWTHIITQIEFTNKVDPIVEIFKSRALMSYLDRHPKFGEPTRELFARSGCADGQEFLNKVLGIIVPHLLRKEDPNPGEYIFRIRVGESEPVLEVFVVDPKDIASNKELQLDYLGMKKKPLLKFSEKEYIVPYWDFVYTTIVTGMLHYVYENSAIRHQYEKAKYTKEENEKGFRKFKGTVGKQFSEGVLFNNTMRKCFNRKHDTLCFFTDNEVFNPDCYYRHGKNIFIFEFKDYMLGSDIIHSGSFEKIKMAIDEKFVQEQIEKNGAMVLKDRGAYQLARNIELLAANEDLFWQVDLKAASQKLKLRNMTIHPIIVQTNVSFDIPDMAEYLNEVVQERLKDLVGYKRVAPLRMIAFKYFRDKMLMFADRQLELIDEIESYENVIDKQKKRFRRTGAVDDWFHSLTPFSYVDSTKYRQLTGYRQNDAVAELNACWEISDK